MKRNKTIRNLIVLAVLAGAIAAAVTVSRSAKVAKYERAEAYMEAGRYEEAMAAFKELNGFDKAQEQYARAKAARVAELEESGDWDGVLKLIDADHPDYIKAVAGKAVALASSGQEEQAFRYVEEAINPGYDTQRRCAKEAVRARVLMSLKRWDEAEAIFRETGYRGYNQEEMYALADQCAFRQFMMLDPKEQKNRFHESAMKRREEAERLMRQLAQGYSECEAAGDEKGMEAVWEFVVENYSDCRNDDALQNVLTARVRSLYDAGRYGEAWDRLNRMNGDLYPKQDSWTALENEMFEDMLANERWKDLSECCDSKFMLRAEADESLEYPYYLASSGRADLIGTEPDFNTLIAAWDAGRYHFGVVVRHIFEDLYHASGDPSEQYAAARAYARSANREAEFLGFGMDIAAAAAAGEPSPYRVRREILPLLPSAAETAGGDDAWLMSDFTAAYGEIADFRASEARPDRYTLIVRDSSCNRPRESLDDAGAYVTAETLNGMETRCISLINRLEPTARNGGGHIERDFLPAHNPNTAAYLVVIEAKYELIGTYFQSGDGVSYGKPVNGYAHVFDLSIVDTRNGETIARTEARHEPPRSMKSADYLTIVAEECTLEEIMEGFGDTEPFWEAVDSIFAGFCEAHPAS